MQRADRVTALLLLAFALAYGLGGARYTYWAPHGPGPGFFPRWLALALGMLALMLLVRSVRGPGDAAGWRLLPAGSGLRRLVAVLSATVAFVIVLPAIGMSLGIALFLLGVLRVVEGFSWRASVAIAIVVAAANHAVFTLWLRIPFPVGPFGF